MLRSRLDRFGGPSIMVTFDSFFSPQQNPTRSQGFLCERVLEYTKRWSLKSVILDIDSDWVLCFGG